MTSTKSFSAVNIQASYYRDTPITVPADERKAGKAQYSGESPLSHRVDGLSSTEEKECQGFSYPSFYPAARNNDRVAGCGIGLHRHLSKSANTAIESLRMFFGAT
jgi:hypothetical protein